MQIEMKKDYKQCMQKCSSTVLPFSFCDNTFQGYIV